MDNLIDSAVGGRVPDAEVAHRKHHVAGAAGRHRRGDRLDLPPAGPPIPRTPPPRPRNDTPASIPMAAAMMNEVWMITGARTAQSTCRPTMRTSDRPTTRAA